MQKKLIALAVAGLVSGSAFAQSNVTIYGVMDATWESIKTSGATDGTSNVATHTRLASNSSYIGFKGAESLGNGLTAVFQFENGINADTSGWGSGRDTMVALAGGFGTVAAGNLTGPVRAIGAAVDFNPGASSAGFTGSMYGEVLGLKTGTDERSMNAIAYISPTVAGGLYGVVAYQNGTPAADGSSVNKKSHAYTLGVVYANGPIFAGFGYINAKNPSVGAAVLGQAALNDPTATAAEIALALDPTGTLVTAADVAAMAAADDKLTNYRLAGKYSFPFGLSISGLWDVQKYTVVNVTDAKRTAYMLGANYNIGANNIWFQYAVAKDVTGAVCNLISCGDTDGKQYTLGYSYSLSKRTMAHAFVSRVKNAQGANYDHYVNGVGSVAAGADTAVYGAGLRHTF